MPCFNDGAYLAEALESVLGQTYTPLELIIVNDGSTDAATNDLLAEIAGPPTLKLNTNRVGPAAARNAGIRAAAGRYVLPLDADDKIHPRYVEKAVAVLESQPKVGVVYCQADYFGARTGRWELPPYAADRMFFGNIIFVTALFRKEDWDRVGGFDESLTHGLEDYDFWLSIMEEGREVVQLPEVLFYYRIKPESRMTRFSSQPSEIKETYQRIYLKHPRFYSRYHTVWADTLRRALICQRVWWARPHSLAANTFIRRVAAAIMSLATRSHREF
jgi:glycosyltransferase involved in cell wall biosynthesis